MRIKKFILLGAALMSTGAFAGTFGWRLDDFYRYVTIQNSTDEPQYLTVYSDVSEKIGKLQIASANAVAVSCNRSISFIINPGQSTGCLLYPHTEGEIRILGTQSDFWFALGSYELHPVTIP